MLSIQAFDQPFCLPAEPAGTKIVPAYDRPHLIESAIETLKHTLFEESLVVALVCVVFLLLVRSALVAILMLLVCILMAFGAMRLLGLGANIMSLGGIAIAIGAMIDGAVVMIENAHKHLERAAPGSDRRDVLVGAAKEVGPALFFSLLVITVSFMPIFTLESQEGRLFGPLGTGSEVMHGFAVRSAAWSPQRSSPSSSFRWSTPSSKDGGCHPKPCRRICLQRS